MRRNPKVQKAGVRQRPKHRYSYYTAKAGIQVSPAVKQGLAEIAAYEGRTLSWVVSEVFRFYFGLKDDTPVAAENRTKIRRVK